MTTSSASRPQKQAPASSSPQRRRHRPRTETKALLMEAAIRVATSRITDEEETHNVLADVKIKDVLAEVNRLAASKDEPTLTTGAFYQIWSDQAEFQRELLNHVMNQIAVPGISDIEALAFQLVSEGEPADEILRQVADLDFTASRESPELYLALGLGALVPAEMVRRAQLDANLRYVSALSELLQNLIRYGGRQLRPDRTMTDLIWALEALEVGYLLRWRTDPELPERRGANGWTAFSEAFVGIVHAFTEDAARRDAG